MEQLGQRYAGGSHGRHEEGLILELVCMGMVAWASIGDEMIQEGAVEAGGAHKVCEGWWSRGMW